MLLPHKFDLVTGTPPYIPPGAGIKSERPQRGPCCFEERGGVEEYCAAAAQRLLPEGRFVMCSGEGCDSLLASVAFVQLVSDE